MARHGPRPATAAPATYTIFNEREAKNPLQHFGFYWIIATFAVTNDSKDGNIQMAEQPRPLPRADGAHVPAARAHAHVLQGIPEGNGPARCQLHWHRAADIVFHRGGDMHTDEAQHSKPVDAAVDHGLRDARDNAAGVLVVNHVPHTCGQGWLEHSLRNRHDARHPAD